MIKLTRQEMARLNNIRAWMVEQHRLRIQMENDPVVVQVLKSMPEKMRVSVFDMQMTPFSHVKWLLAVIDRYGVGTK